MGIIKVKNLRKTFGNIKAVDDISFEINKGETFGLLGPNGAGKTTTINSLVGAIKIDSGSIEIDGFTDPTNPQLRYKIGLAPQEISLYEDLSGKENLSFWGKVYNLSGALLKERIDWALDFVGLTERKKDLVKTYSSGMKRRLNLACSLLHNPPILFLDEPVVGVDPQSRNRIFECIESLKKKGITIIYTTHYMEEAERLCDRVAIIDFGKILALDTVENLITKYGEKWVIKVEFENTVDFVSVSNKKFSGSSFCIETEKPFEDIAKLSLLGRKILNLQIERPTLETVFLSLTGRSLRDL